MITQEDWEIELGRQVRTLRLRQNIDQRELADRGGMSLNAIKHLEGGGGTTLRSFVKVLRALNRDEWLGTLAPEVSISPVQMLKIRAPRKRASRKSSKKI